MELAIVVAMADNRAIGIKNGLPWRLPEDLKRFKEITMGHPMIMGRLTFDSIGRALPGRVTIVVTRDNTWPAPDGVVATHNLEEALAAAELEAKKLGVETIMIVGGANVYEQLLPRCNKLFVTEVHTSVTGDAFFPAINLEVWAETNRRKYMSNAAELLAYSFVEYQKRQ